VLPFENPASYRERRCAAAGTAARSAVVRRATEAYPKVCRKERNAAGVDAAALECSRILGREH
jgi:hypothetical protein